MLPSALSGRELLPLLILVVAAPALGQNFGKAPIQEVTLADYKFNPSEIHLSAGKPVILRLKNLAAQPHEFAAPQLFASATVRSADAKLINKEGEVELLGGKQVEIGLVPKAGTYHSSATSRATRCSACKAPSSSSNEHRAPPRLKQDPSRCYS